MDERDRHPARPLRNFFQLVGADGNEKTPPSGYPGTGL